MKIMQAGRESKWILCSRKTDVKCAFFYVEKFYEVVPLWWSVILFFNVQNSLQMNIWLFKTKYV